MNVVIGDFVAACNTALYVIDRLEGRTFACGIHMHIQESLAKALKSLGRSDEAADAFNNQIGGTLDAGNLKYAAQGLGAPRRWNSARRDAARC